MIRRGPTAASVLAAVLALSANSAVAASPADSLVLNPDQVPGLRAGKVSTAVAGQTIAQVLPPSLRGGHAEARAFTGQGVRLAIAAVSLKTQAGARLALRTWVRSKKRPPGVVRPLKGVGDAAVQITSKGTGRTGGDVLIALASGSGFALVRLTAATPADAQTLSRSYAQSEAAQLSTALGRTALDRVMEQLPPDGRPTAKMTLQLYALLYGPLPGVALPRGSRSTTGIEGTGVLQQVFGPSSKLSASQRELVVASIRRGNAQRRAVPEPGRKRAHAYGGCPYETKIAEEGLFLDDTASRRAEVMRSRVEAAIGIPPGATSFPTCVYRLGPEVKKSSGLGRAVAGTTPMDRSTGIDWASSYVLPDGTRVAGPNSRHPGPVTLDACEVQTYTPAIEDATLAHEMAHCIQMELVPRRTYLPWVDEGIAGWAAALTVGNSASRAVNWFYHGWLGDELRNPIDRGRDDGYASLGFFGLVDEHRPTFRGGVLNVWLSETTIEAYDASVGDAEIAIEDDWAPGRFGQPTWPKHWDQTIPFLASGQGSKLPRTTPLIAGSDRAPQLASRYYSIPHVASNDFVQVTISKGRLTDTETDWARPDGGWYCFEGACKCPPGKKPNAKFPVDLNIVKAPLYAGIAAGQTTATITVKPHRLAEFCEKDDRPPASPEDGTRRSRGSSNGDPHLETFDGLHFDFQAAGEYVLARSASGDFEIQARQEPFAIGGKRLDDATVNTQIAARIAGKRVSLSQDGTLRVDGRTPKPNSSIALGAGAMLEQRDGGQIVLTWPDGSRVWAQAAPTLGVSFNVNLAASRAGKVAGMLGNDDGDPANDLTSRDGKSRTAFTSSPPTESGDTVVTHSDDVSFANSLYKTIGESWRVEQAKSLLDYGRGQSTATFTNRKIPVRVVTGERFDDAVFASALATCKAAGVTEPVRQQDCARDIALTGNAAFADAAARTEENAISDTSSAISLGTGDRGVSVAIDTDGTGHVAWIERTADQSRIHYRRIPSGGGEPTPDQVLRTAPPTALGSVRLLDDTPRGRILAVINTTDAAIGMEVLASTDRGATWSTPKLVYPGFWSDAVDLAPDGHLSFIARQLGLPLATIGADLTPIAETAVVPLTDAVLSRLGVLVATDASGATYSVFQLLDRTMAHLGTTAGPDVQTGPASDRVSLSGLTSGALVVTSEKATVARTLLPDGRVTAPVRLSAANDSDTYQVASAASRTGKQIAAWRNSTRGLNVARSSDPTAQAWSPARTLTTITNPSGKGGIDNPSVAINSAGRSIVGWQAAGQTWAVAIP